MRAWLAHHRRALAMALGRLAGSPFSTLFNVLVIGIALALPVGLHTVVHNAQTWAAHVPADPHITLFLKRDASRTQAAELERRLRQREEVKAVSFVPREQALEELERSTGIADLLLGLEHNPLPDAFVVEARDARTGALEPLRIELAAWPEVEHAQLDAVWARRLEALLGTARAGLFALATTLAFALVAVTFNTIRLQVLTRRADIEVAQLFGATSAYIRRPFLYDGALLGALGALAGCGLVAAGVVLLNRELAVLSELYGVRVALEPVPLADLLAIGVFASLLGWMGAWLSLAQHGAAGVPR